MRGGSVMAKIGVIGAGSWGTALALLCHKNGPNGIMKQNFPV